MFTLAICTILNGYTQVNRKKLLIQSYHTTCVSFSCEFICISRIRGSNRQWLFDGFITMINTDLLIYLKFLLIYISFQWKYVYNFIKMTSLYIYTEVVERRTPEREVQGSNPTTAL